MEHTLDRPAPGLCVAQPRRGFRYGAEAFWLAGFAVEVGGAKTVLDLGTGSGVIALLLAGRGLDALGVDHRPEWEPLWKRTLMESKVKGRIRLTRSDVADGPAHGRFDLVVSNPPFFPAGTGPVAPDPLKRAARTESTATLACFVAMAMASLTEHGRCCMVVPREREDALIAAGAPHDARPLRVVRVGRRRTLVELGRTGSPQPAAELTEGDDRVQGWYAAVSGAPWRE